MILIFICVQTLRDSEKRFLPQRIFLVLSCVTILMLVADILSRFDGHPGTIYPVLNHIGNFTVFLFNLFIPSLWVLYTHFLVFRDVKRLRHLFDLLCILIGINIVLLLFSQRWGWLYSIDEKNIYHRGPLYWYPVALTIAFSAAAFLLALINRKRIERNRFLSILLFPVPPLICMALQLTFYGSSLMLNGVALSLLILFIILQNRNMNIDYLTGAYNRKRFETYMKEKINVSTIKKTFSAILIDLDDFKTINDTYGHDIGDDALTKAVSLIKSCLGSFDFIARIGGDEFCIILDTSQKEELEMTVSKIDRRIGKYNKQNKSPYQLSFSMGYAVYDYQSHLRSEEFVKHIDGLMYEKKRARKEKLE